MNNLSPIALTALGVLASAIVTWLPLLFIVARTFGRTEQLIENNTRAIQGILDDKDIVRWSNADFRAALIRVLAPKRGN